MRPVHVLDLRDGMSLLSYEDAGPGAIWFFLGTDYRSLTGLQAAIGNRVREAEFGQEYHETVNAFRQEYVDYIGTRYAALGSLSDRYSGFLEKSPFISGIFQNICFIRLALRILERYPCAPAFIICQDHILAHDLCRTLRAAGESCIGGPAAVTAAEKIALYTSGTARIAYTGLVILSRMLSGRSLSARARELLRDRDNVILIHTWMSAGSIASGEYREGFFADLQNRLEGSGYTPVLVPHIPYDLSFRQCMAALDRSKKFFLPEEHFLTIPALCRTLAGCLFRRPRREEHTIGGTDISGTVHLQEYRDRPGLQYLMPLAWEEIVRNIPRQGFRVRTFVLLHENYSFEKAIIGAFRRWNPETTVIGYQHSTVTSNHISYCLSSSGSDRVFIPDLVITNGTSPHEFLIRNHYPPELVVAGGALRYAGSAGAPNPRAGSPAGKQYTLLTLPGVLDESVEILEKVYAALGTGDRRVLAKVHPFIPVDRLEEATQREVLDRFEFTAEPLGTVLPGADLLIYSTSSTCIDALSHGIPVLRILSDRRLDIDPLLDFRKITPFIGVATHPEEIRRMIPALAGREFSAPEREELARIVSAIFGPVDDSMYALFTSAKKTVIHKNGN